MIAGDIIQRGKRVVLTLPSDPSVEVTAQIQPGESPEDAARRLLTVVASYVVTTMAHGLVGSEPTGADYERALEGARAAAKR